MCLIKSVAALSDVGEIKIFMAGNFTKSALVKKIFAEFIEGDKTRKLLEFGKNKAMPKFILFRRSALQRLIKFKVPFQFYVGRARRGKF